MNNYLDTIVARTLNPTSPLRPRLRGRFEEAPALKLPIEESKRLRAGSPPPVPTSQATEQSGALNTTRPQDVEHRPTLSLDPPPNPARSSDIAADLSWSAPPATDHKIAPSPPVPAAGATPSPLPETSRQTLNARQPSIKPPVDLTEQTGPTHALPPRLPEKTFEPNHESIPVRFPAADDHGAVNHSTLKPRQSPNTAKPSQQRDGEADGLPHSRRRKQKELSEHEVERVIIREKAVDGEPRGNPPASPALFSTSPAVSQNIKPRDSRAEPFVRSRIAPRIDSPTEHRALRRRNAPPQPTVHVTIGRLEVRAVQSSHVRPKPQTAGPVMNLEDYLKRRSQGGTR